MGELTKDQAVGVVRDYFRKVEVAAIEVTGGTLRIGDTIRIKGHTTDLVGKIDSMQVNHQDVMEANPGDLVGIKVSDRVRDNDLVFIEGGKVEEVM
ncbi:MAG: translation elongation factor-like protein [Bacteroidetes bacterium]|nr:MAG: translation elongation factor-like protein [Bacteroidota bacterium]